MERLRKTERTEILRVIESGDRTQSLSEVGIIFLMNHIGTANLFPKLFHETGSMKDRPKYIRPVTFTPKENSLSIM